MKPIMVFASVLCCMAVVDLYFSARLKAEFRQSVANDFFESVAVTDDSGAFFPVSAIPGQPLNQSLAVTQVEQQEESIHLVESALNSRYMQWGAVGVMLMLFCWLLTKHLPNQEKRRSEESAQIRESFIKSIEKRDEQYLTALSEIRRSVETHVERVIEAKDRQTEAFHELAGEVRSRG